MTINFSASHHNRIVSKLITNKTKTLFSMRNVIYHFEDLNPNRAGFFEGSFSWGWGSQFDPPFIFQEELI